MNDGRLDKAGRVRDAGSAAAQLKGLAAGMSRNRENGQAGRREARVRQSAGTLVPGIAQNILLKKYFKTTIPMTTAPSSRIV